MKFPRVWESPLFIMLLCIPVVSVAQIGSFPLFEKAKDTRNSEDPISTVGHGQLYDQSGKLINKISPKFIQNTLNYYLNRLQKESKPKIRSLTKKRLAELKDRFPKDQMTQHFLMLEWLTETVAPHDKAILYHYINSRLG